MKSFLNYFSKTIVFAWTSFWAIVIIGVLISMVIFPVLIFFFNEELKYNYKVFWGFLPHFVALCFWAMHYQDNLTKGDSDESRRN